MADQQAPQPMIGVDPAAVAMELLRAVQHTAQTASSATDPREMQEAASAALNFAQAIVILDPGMTPDGVPVAGQQAHDLTMQAADHKAQAEQAQARASAPSPARSVKPNG